MKKDRSPASRRPVLSRRAFLRASLAVPSAALLAACADDPAATTVPAEPSAASPQAPATSAPATSAPAGEPALTPEPTLAAQKPTVAAALQPTPACGDDDDDVTPPQTEGPFFTPNSPERTSLREPGLAGVPMVLVGTVLSIDCQPIAGALIDFWHADDAGVYDNVGFKLRGHQFADADGRYRLETIVPGLYPGRTRHFHVKVQAPNQPVLTTQLYFPDEQANASDGIFDPALLMAVQDTDAGKSAVFDFVLYV